MKGYLICPGPNCPGNLGAESRRNISYARQIGNGVDKLLLKPFLKRLKTSRTVKIVVVQAVALTEAPNSKAMPPSH